MEKKEIKAMDRKGEILMHESQCDVGKIRVGAWASSLAN